MAPGRPFSTGLAQPRAIAPALQAPRKLAVIVLVAGAAFLATVAQAPAEPARPLTGTEEQPAEREAVLRARPLEVAPGAVVTLEGRDFPAETDLEVGAGPPHSAYDVIDHTVSDGQGRVHYEILLPLRAEPGEIVIFVVATEDFMVKGVSNPVTITGQTGAAVASR